MRIIKILKFLYKSKEPHFLSVPKDIWYKWGLLIRLVVGLNKNYNFCTIYRKKYKHHSDIVVVGLKWTGKRVKRRTTGFAKKFLSENKETKCIYCETKLTNDNATTDHIVPISEGGNNAQINLVVVCFDCNNGRGNLEFSEFMRIKNPGRKSKFI